MNKSRLIPLLFSFCCFFQPILCSGQSDPLPSWNEGEAKRALLRFVEETVTPGSKDYVNPEDRIAVFDQDGTLWVEQPMYTQFVFALDRIKELAAQHPDWKNKEHFKAIIDGDLEKIKNFSMHEIEQILAETHSNITVEQFRGIVRLWLSQARHPRFDKLYTDLIYQPMVEVIRYFSANGYRVYIVSGGGQEFIRSYSETVYDIPTQQIVGTASTVKYVYENDTPELVKLPDILFIDDKAGKPEAINLFIGKHPVAAFGNSDGDRQMLEWSQAGKGKNIQILIHHDDPLREYAYDVDSKIGTFSKSLFEEAHKRGWFVVSMKNDWKTIFPSK
jgi:phosphoglycolate phosphatase-like HAD superfamily hydrolase